jgi:DNA-binding NarL/FixJ family response regulator
MPVGPGRVHPGIMADETTPGAGAVTTVMVVDDHPGLRAALRGLLQREPGVRVVAEAATVEEAAGLIGHVRPAVTLLDISLSGESGLGAVPRLKAIHPEGRVVMYSLHDEPAYARAALDEGADGYVVKDDPSSLLVAVGAA